MRTIEGNPHASDAPAGDAPNAEPLSRLDVFGLVVAGLGALVVFWFGGALALDVTGVWAEGSKPLLNVAAPLLAAAILAAGYGIYHGGVRLLDRAGAWGYARKTYGLMGYRRPAERARPGVTEQCRACTLRPGDRADYSDGHLYGYRRVVAVRQGRNRVRIEMADGQVYRPRANEWWWRAAGPEL